MSDDNIVNIDTSNDTAGELDINLDDTSTEVDVDALKEQNKRLFARAKKAEGFTQDAQGNWVKREKPQTINNAVEHKPYNILEYDVADLIFEGYKKDEVKFILANGGRKALDDKDSYVSLAIKAKKEQSRVEDAVGQTSSKGFVASGGKTYTEEQLRNMSAEEMEKVLPHN